MPMDVTYKINPELVLRGDRYDSRTVRNVRVKRVNVELVFDDASSVVKRIDDTIEVTRSVPTEEEKFMSTIRYIANGIQQEIDNAAQGYVRVQLQKIIDRLDAMPSMAPHVTEYDLQKLLTEQFDADVWRRISWDVETFVKAGVDRDIALVAAYSWFESPRVRDPLSKSSSTMHNLFDEMSVYMVAQAKSKYSHIDESVFHEAKKRAKIAMNGGA